MDDKRLKHVLTIVDAVISMEPEKRQGYLTEVCEDNNELKKEVLNLLKSIDKSEAFWEDWQDWNEKQIHQLLEEEPDNELSEETLVGPWKLKRLLGHGGMGKVFLAERFDGQYDQQAAVKILLQGLTQGETMRRFEQERQILARLDHPNIAHFYDGGITTDGRPWLAMQYVDGISISSWSKRDQCSLEERLDHFVKVCEAVRYAHKNLIVHRDLKPDNILVSGDGKVKVLDFGIAKLIDEEVTESRRIQTQTGLRVMSLDYAAPEQVVGEPVTTATDVYALGLVLYELLTDSYPFDLKGKNQKQIEQIIRNHDPVKPSLVSMRWQNKIHGDLDAIILKALRKEPEQRYENAGQLLDDICRYQTNLPVVAQRDTVRYRLNKLYKRNRRSILSGVAVLASIISLVVYYTFQITEERNKAREEAAKAEEISTFLEGLFNASDPFMAAETGRPDTMQVRGFLKRGADKIRQEMHDQPLVQARMLNVIGDVYYNLGLFDEALPLLEESLNIREEDGGNSADIAQVLESIAQVLQSKGDFDSAENNYTEVLQLQDEYRENNEKVAKTKVRLAMLLSEKSAYGESEKLLNEALTIQKRELGNNHPDVAETFRSLGVLYHRQAAVDKAEIHYRKSLELYEELYGEQHLDVAQSLLNLSTLLREKGDYDAAEPLMKQVLEIQNNILGEEHPNTITTMYELAILLRDNSEPKLEEAADLFSKVIEMDKKQRGEIHHYVGLDLIELGITLNKLGNVEKAMKTYKEALIILRQALPEDHPDIAMALIGLGDTLIRDDNPREAEPLLAEALQIRQEKFGESTWRTGVSKSVLGWAIMMQGRYNEAEPLLLDGYNTLQTTNGPQRAALARLVMLYERKGETANVDKFKTLLSEAKY